MEHELDKASTLIERADGLFDQFAPGSIERVAWDHLKRNVAGWYSQTQITDPRRRMLRIGELQRQLEDVKALLCEAGLLGASPL